jgi:dTDP-4-dehydrorhamnose 3,5-epimerase-like enzyme
MHQPTHDQGIRFDSFGKKWETENPIINQRDKEWPSFEDYKSPF